MSSGFSILQQNTTSYVLVDLFETTVLKYGSHVSSSVPNVNNPGFQFKDYVSFTYLLGIIYHIYHYLLLFQLPVRHRNCFYLPKADVKD